MQKKYIAANVLIALGSNHYQTRTWRIKFRKHSQQVRAVYARSSWLFYLQIILILLYITSECFKSLFLRSLFY